jgi:cyclophilin family peptidyl-prolyl cis-trans isomerase
MGVMTVFATLLTLLVQTQAAPAAPINPNNPVVVLETSMGDITIELRQDRAPVSVANFLNYAKTGHYDGTIFHRVLRGFMIQGGGFTPGLVAKPTGPPIRNEATNGLRNLRGTVAMARAAAVRSATAEFFINVEDNSQLNHRSLTPDEYGYAVFGRVIAGMDVVDKIAGVQVQRREGHEAVPVTPVVIKRVRPR